jgi:hypothetical protein
MGGGSVHEKPSTRYSTRGRFWFSVFHNNPYLPAPHTRTHRYQNCSPTPVGRATLEGTERYSFSAEYRTSVPPTRTRPATRLTTTRHPACRRASRPDQPATSPPCRAVAAPSAANPDFCGPVPARCSCTACARFSGQPEITAPRYRLDSFLWCTQPACHPVRVLAPIDAAVSPDHPPCRIGGSKWCSGARCSHARATSLKHGRRTSRCTRRCRNCRGDAWRGSRRTRSRRTSAAQRAFGRCAQSGPVIAG